MSMSVLNPQFYHFLSIFQRIFVGIPVRFAARKFRHRNEKRLIALAPLDIHGIMHSVKTPFLALSVHPEHHQFGMV